MKKALITAALALGFSAGAMADITLDWNDLAANNGSYTIPSEDRIGSGYGNVVLTMTLNAARFQNLLTAETVSATNIITATGSSNTKIGIGISAVDRTYNSTTVTETGLNGSWQSSTVFAQDFAINGSTQVHDLSTLKELLSTNTYTSIALSYSLNGAGAFANLTLVDGEGIATTISGVKGNLKASGFGSIASITYNTDLVQYVSIIAGTNDNNYIKNASDAEPLNLAAIDAVPEPATATLSLLALAGLAARRRRK